MEIFPTLEVGATRDIVAKKVGWSGRTYEKAKKLLEERGFEYSYQTLANDKYTAKQIPLSLRKERRSLKTVTKNS